MKKPHENAAIGVLLCATKDQQVVEYALSPSASPALVASYQSQLPDKKLLQAKLHEFYALAAQQVEPSASATAPFRGAESQKLRTAARRADIPPGRRKRKGVND